MDLSNRDSRNFCPCLVGVSVVVQEFIAQHQSNSEKPVFTSWFPLDCGIKLFQPVDEEKSEDNDILGHLSSRQNRGDPFPKSSGRGSVLGQRLQRGIARNRRLSPV